MEIQTEKDVTGAVAKDLRERLGMTQKAFWTALGITQPGGCRYENGSNVPKPIRILIFVNYVAGLRIDATTVDGASGLKRLAALQASETAAHAEKIGKKMAQAMSAVRDVNKLLNSVA